MSRPGRVPLIIYHVLAALLPPGARDDRHDMERTFEELCRERPGGWGHAWRGLTALAGVLLVEWLDHLSARGRIGMGMVRNVRYALRTLRNTPTFSVTSMLLVAVGVGAVTTIFTLVDHVLLRPLPYPQSERLVFLDRGSFQGPFFHELEGFSSVTEWGAAWHEEVNLVGEGEPLRLSQARVSRDFFDLFGAHAALGRLLAPEDFESADRVVLDAGFWRRVLGADPAVVGRSIQVDGEAVTVVGVVEDRFAPPELLTGPDVDVWRPLDWSAPELLRHDTHVLQIAGRMSSSTDLASVRAELARTMTRMADVHRNYRTREGAPREVPAVPLAEETVRAVRTGLGLLMGAVGLLLLVACANVANLFLARGLGRTREMAVRRAMGAGTGNLTVQLLVESMIVGLGGGLVGTGLAWAGIRAFVGLSPTALPRQATVALDVPVLVFAVAVSAVTSLLFGLLPALRSVGGQLADELRGGGRSATAGRGVTLLRNALVAAEVALSLVLVAGAGLLLRSFLTVRAQDPGFRIADVWTIPLNLPDPESADAFRRSMDEVLLRVRTVSGVRDAAYALTAPLQFQGGSRCCWSTRAVIPGREEDDALRTSVHPVTPGYFAAAGVDLVAGRSWVAAESRGEPIPVVVDELLARELAGSATAAVGTTLGLNDFHTTVVGVARSNRHYGLDQEPDNALYLPIEHMPFPIPIGTIIARVDPSANAAMPRALRQAVWDAIPTLPVTAVRSMEQSLDASTATRRFDSLIFGAFAGVALLLAAGGLYGTLLYLAGQRKRELGIRLALGATRGRIEAQVLKVGVALGACGVAAGLAGSWVANRYLESRIWGVDRGDPFALGGASLLLLATAVVASWLPARRASRVDPLETLRVE